MSERVGKIIELKEYFFYNLPTGANRRVVLEDKLKNLKSYSTALMFNFCGDQPTEVRDAIEDKIKALEVVVKGVLPPENIRDN